MTNQNAKNIPFRSYQFKIRKNVRQSIYHYYSVHVQNEPENQFCIMPMTPDVFQTTFIEEN